MPTIVEKVLSRFGYARNGVKADSFPPILNDGMGNRPSIRVHNSPYGAMGGANWTPREYRSHAEAGYQKNSDVYSCISLIATAGKQVRWWDGSGDSKSLTPIDMLVKAIGRKPEDYRASVFDGEAKLQLAGNPRASIELLEKIGGASFVEEWLSYILLSGNTYTEIVRSGSRISMLYLDNPGLVSAEINRDALHKSEVVTKWIVRNGYGKQRTLDPWGKGDSVVVQSKLFHPTDPVYGMAPLEAAMIRVDAQNEGATLMKRVLQRGYVPGWIEAREHSEWNDEQVAALKSGIQRSKMHGEELFLENAVWHPMGFEPTNAGVSEQQILTKRDIASVFHVPPQLIGDTTTSTYSNYREARRALYMEAVIPLLVQFRDDWNRTIGAELKSPLDFDRDSFDAISAAREEATDRATKLWTSGLITRNEARADLEYDAPKSGDTFYGPANLVPMDAGTEDGEEE
jgi:HK97 family phage portal protein